MTEPTSVEAGPEAAGGRCRVYPSRPAPRGCVVCGGTGLGGGTGTAACGAVVAAPPGPAVIDSRTLQTSVIRSALGSSATMLGVSLGVADYIEAGFLGILLPFLMGLAISIVSQRVALPVRGVLPQAIAAVYAAIGVGYAFWVNAQPYGTVGQWLPPLVAALVGVPAAVLIFPVGPPRGPDGERLSEPGSAKRSARRRR